MVISAILLLAPAGCSIGGRKEVAVSGAVKTKTVEGSAVSLTVEDITVRIGSSTGGPKVELISDGGKARVEVEAPESLLDAVVVKFSGSSLRVTAAQDGLYVTSEPVKIRLYNYSFEKLTFSGACEVTDGTGLGGAGKDLTVKLSGASSLKTERLTAAKLAADLSGASRLTAGKMELDSLNLDVSGASVFSCRDCTVKTKCEWHMAGASTLELAGTGNDLFAVINGASAVKAFDFEQKTCTLTVSGASTVECRMTETLGGSILHGSSVYYKGDPQTLVEVSSSAKLEKK
ncbi:MAG: DUF2807 domain-containing protein [Lachnospiraceae bacterium]|nr:DUF2807 domain-containing protein [Lachnospiraceae bacterium]